MCAIYMLVFFLVLSLYFQRWSHRSYFHWLWSDENILWTIVGFVLEQSRVRSNQENQETSEFINESDESIFFNLHNFHSIVHVTDFVPFGWTTRDRQQKPQRRTVEANAWSDNHRNCWCWRILASWRVSVKCL